MAESKSEATNGTSESTAKEKTQAVTNKVTMPDSSVTRIENKAVKGGDKSMVVKKKPVDSTGEFDYSKATEYQVQDGDTLYSVAQKFLVAMEQLRYFNHIRPGKDLRAGKIIYIPKEPVYVPVGK